MKRGMWWPISLAGVLATTVAANIWVAVIANDDPSFAIEPDYYRKAVDWDRRMAQEARNAELGWGATASLEPQRGGHARLVARITDREGRPLTGATVTVEAFASARANRMATVTLTPETTPGAYAATLDGARPGLWELRLRVVRGEQVFTRTLDQDLAAAR